MRRIAWVMTSAVVIAVTGLFLAAGSAEAQIGPRDQGESDLVFDEQRGQYLLIWVEDRGAGNRIFAKRIHENGLPVGGSEGGEWELTAPTGTGAMAGQKGDQRHPAVVDDLLVWSEQAPGANDYDIYAQRLFGNFRAYGTPRMIAGGAGNQSFPDVVANNRNGEWLVVWSEDTSDAGDVMGMRLSAALTPRSKVFEVAKGPGTAEDPTIARDLMDSDSFLVLFTDDRNGNRDIFGVRVSEAGLPRGGAASAFEVVTSPEDDYSPTLVVNASPVDRRIVRTRGPRTRHALLWTTDHVTDGPDVMALRLNNNGIGQGDPFVVAGGQGAQQHPAGDLRSSDLGRAQWLITWSDDNTGTLDVVGVEVELNGITRRNPRTMVAD